MRGEKQSLFKHTDVPKDLYSKVIVRIHNAEQKNVQRYFIISLCSSVASVVALVFAGIWLYRDLAYSGFIQAFQLLFSDSGIVFQYWKDFTAMLVEGLPYLSLATSLAAIVLVMISIRSFTRSINIIYG